MFYAHNDAQFTRRGLIQEAVEAVCRHHARHAQWGILLFHYDVFCAYRVEALRQTGMWDIYIPNYKVRACFLLPFLFCFVFGR